MSAARSVIARFEPAKASTSAKGRYDAEAAFTSSVTGLAASGVGISSIVWTWNPVATATGYTFMPSTGGAGIDVMGTSLAMTGLPPNTPWSGKVRARRLADPGPLSAAVTGYTLAALPLNLRLGQVYVTSMTVAWDAPGNPAGTRYLLSRWSPGKSTTTVIVSPADPSINVSTLTALSANTAYRLNIRAENGRYVSTPFDPAVEIGTRTLASKPIVAPRLTAIGVDTGTVRWTWSAVSGADEAEDYLFYPSTGGPPILTSALSLTASGLSPNSPYSGKVQARNFVGAGPLSAAVTGFTLAAAPKALAIQRVNVTSMTVTWDGQGNPHGTKYLLSHWIAGKATATVTVAPADPSVNVSTIAGLLPNVHYNINVRAENGKLQVTDFEPAVGQAALTQPMRPSIAPALTATAVDTATLRWSWPAITGASAAESYLFYPSTGGPALETTTNFLLLTGLSTNTAYGGKLQAKNPSGAGPLSATVTGYSLAAAPTGFAISGIFGSSATLDWSLSGNPTGTEYAVAYWTAGTSTKTVLTQARPVTLTSLLPGTSYNFAIQAINGRRIATPLDSATQATGTTLGRITVVLAGNRGGVVTGSPAGIDCGTACTGYYPPGTQVALSARPNITSKFVGWSGGGCSGTGLCIITVGSTESVTAAFSLGCSIVGNGSSLGGAIGGAYSAVPDGTYGNADKISFDNRTLTFYADSIVSNGQPAQIVDVGTRTCLAAINWPGVSATSAAYVSGHGYIARLADGAYIRFIAGAYKDGIVQLTYDYPALVNKVTITGGWESAVTSTGLLNGCTSAACYFFDSGSQATLSGTGGIWGGACASSPKPPLAGSESCALVMDQDRSATYSRATTMTWWPFAGPNPNGTGYGTLTDSLGLFWSSAINSNLAGPTAQFYFVPGDQLTLTATPASYGCNQGHSAVVVWSDSFNNPLPSCPGNQTTCTVAVPSQPQNGAVKATFVCQ